ncbi:hypothetical protein [Amorphus orientalis]|uniref:Uncharacterized protein n=1 Tax=Amorphus orientalis TaxID=649198 RepID=A0AAE3VQC2_9HYPH|nr:hypothetical protein [Amorphus orientalis]MDQ0316192.1 hypothetical protein [Amorphus orientalis]
MSRDLHLIVDGVAFQFPDSPSSRLWHDLLPKLAENVRLTILDRGGAPRVDGAEFVGFPAHTGRDTAADSVLVDRFCKHLAADVFTSTRFTTPLETPMAILVGDLLPAALHQKTATREWREREIAILYAQARICLGAKAGDDLETLFPYLAKDSITVAPAVDLVAGASPPPEAVAVLAEDLVSALHEVAERSKREEQVRFYQKWAQLRALQAEVDF